MIAKTQGSGATHGTPHQINTQATDPYSDVVDAIQRHGCKIQSNTGRTVVAQCPGHDDKQASLSISRGDRQPVVMCCHAGCDTTDILAAIGMAGRDLCKPTDRAEQLTYRNPDSTVYTYTDEGGRPLYDVVRTGNGRNKRFIQRRYTEDGSTANGLKDTRRVLYNLPQVIKAVSAGDTVYLVEGEKDVETIRRLGRTATTTNNGAQGLNALPTSAWTVLQGATVVAVPDRDAAGDKWADKVQRIIGPVAATITLVMADVSKIGADTTDHIEAGGTLGTLVPWQGSAGIKTGEAGIEKSDTRQTTTDVNREITGQAGMAGMAGMDSQNFLTGVADEGDGDGKRSIAGKLLDILRERYDLGCDDRKSAYAIDRKSPMRIALPLRGSEGLRQRMARAYADKYGSPPSASALGDMLTVAEGLAQDADPETPALRVAERNGAWWIDLGTASGEVIQLTASGWQVTTECPVLWRRTALTGPMPTPRRGGTLNALWDVLNVSKDDRGLIVAWMIAALIPDMAHPILVMTGEQGTGKSTAMKTLVSIIDPSPVPLRRAPRDVDQWMTAADGSWVVSLDNLRSIRDDLSDALCRAVTGDADVRRALYTDGGLHVIAMRRVVLLNGIDLGAVAGDLADRAIPVALDVIDAKSRREDAELDAMWATEQPRILGAVLDNAVKVLAARPRVRLTERPRMADFARILAALDMATGSKTLNRFLERQAGMAAEALAGDPVVDAVTAEITTEWEGTASQLLETITPTEDGWRPSREWPRTARAMTTWLKRMAPVMRKGGWRIDDLGNRNKAGIKHWAITAPVDASALPAPAQLQRVESDTPHGWWIASNCPAHDDCAECLAKKPLVLTK